MRSLPNLVLSLAALVAPSCSGRDLDFGEPPPVIAVRPPPGGILDSTSGLARPVNLALAGDTIVFSTPSQVMTIPLSGGTPVVRSTDGPVVGLVSDTRFAFWIDWVGTVHVLDLATDSVSVVIAGQGQPSGIALDGSNIYWTASAGLYSLPRIALRPGQGGVFFRTELAAGFSRVGRVTAGAGSVVFVAFDEESPNGRLVRLPISGDPPNPVAEGTFAVASVATDGVSAFWTDFRDAEGGVYSAPLTGGEATRLAVLQQIPGDVVVVGPHLYFSDILLKRVTTSGAPDGWMGFGPVDCYAASDRAVVWVTSDSGAWALMVRTP